MYRNSNRIISATFFRPCILRKFFRVMKLTIALCLLALMQVKATTYGQKINLDARNTSLENVLSIISKQTGCNFIYSSSMLKEASPISISVKNKSLSDVLDLCFHEQPLTYVLNGNTVVITKKAATISMVDKITTDIPPPPVVITGMIVDETGSPITRASVIVKGTSLGTTTDESGSFKINVPDRKAILVISYIGYQEIEVAVGSQNFIRIEMKKGEDKANEEVVVVAYGKQRKIATLGSQSTVNVADIKQPVANISTVLAGRVSGLVGVQRSAEPGRDGADLWIRGIISTADNSPLVLVDGVERTFNNINPNDIQSFTILKDASATAVYGVRGANGVILIETKQGKAGKVNINVDAYTGLTQFTRTPSITDGVTYMQMANEAQVTRGGSPGFTEDRIRKTMTQEDPMVYPNVNWMNELFNKAGNNVQANLNLSGGTQNATYYVSASYYSEKGLFKADKMKTYDSKIKFDRYNFVSRLNLNATKTTKIDLGIKGWISNGNYPGTSTSDIFYYSYLINPTLYPVMYPDNKEPWVSTGGGGGNASNPYALLTNRGYQNEFKNQINSDIRLKQDFSFWVKGLSAYILYSFDATNGNVLLRTKTPPTYYVNPEDGRDENGNLKIYRTDNGNGSDYLTSFSRTSTGTRQFYFEGAVAYNNNFGKHKVGAIGLYNRSDKEIAEASTLITSLPYRSMGAVARGTYSYDDRYLAEVSMGYNGSENFSPNNRFGLFPSMAVGWVASNEKFYEKLGIDNIFSLMKFRASYGLVGNSNITVNGSQKRFAYIGDVNTNTGTYYYGKDRSAGIVGYDVGSYPSDVTWETEKDLNVGVELKALHNSLGLQVDWFKRRRENIFMARQGLPASAGFRTDILGNLGINEGSGLDVTADYNKRFGKVDLQFRGTFTYTTNRVIENDEPAKAYPWLEKRGQKVFQRYGYDALGYYTQDEIDDPKVAKTAGVVMAGDLKFKDMNGDGVIDQFDIVPIGKNQVPQIEYGFGATAAYKGFSLGAFFQGTGMVTYYLGDATFQPFYYAGPKGTPFSNIKDRWTPENPSQKAFYPRLAYGSGINQNYASNSHWVQDGHFLRLKSLDFGYTLPAGALKRLAVQNLRIYFIGYNLLTFSKFKFFDPEMGDGTGTRYPNIKTYSLGFTVTF